MSKLWGGRFTGVTDSNLIDLNCSLPVDSRLFAEDLDGSKAYAEALHLAGILTESECDRIVKSLELVRFEWIEKIIKFEESDEDVHTVNERRLTEICGEVGQKLHTGRSRNDQIATDMKMWMKKAIRELLVAIFNTIKAAVDLAEKHIDVLMPGYTHMQRAQPVLFSHWLLSHAYALRQDCLRFKDLFARVDVLPLGSGALAGNPLGIDREFLAKRLGFARITENSMHAVSDRDFSVEFNFTSSMTCLHLSRLAEDLILYSTKEFNFVSISDEFSTGSSLMPQKRNPDSVELVRGASGNIIGSLISLMVTVKGLPTTYNKDLQFDKTSIFDSFDLLKSILKITKGVLNTLTVNKESCEQALCGEMLATDWAYYLVRKGVPFRTAHTLIGKVVSYAEKAGLDLREVHLDTLKSFCDKFDSDIEEVSHFRGVVNQYNVAGGTSPSSVEKQIVSLRNFIDNLIKTFV